MSGIVSKNAGRGSGVVGSGAVGADAVDGSNIADDAIDSEHYTDGSIDNAHIADDAIDSEHYADGSIDNAHIADDAIDSEHYAAGSIDTAHIADNQITLAKMAGGTDGNIISFDASGDPVAIATGNDGQVLTSTGAGSPPAFEDAGGGGAWNFIASTTISNDSEITFTSLNGSTYDMIVFIWTEVIVATDNNAMYLQTSTDGGSSYDSGAGEYEYVIHSVYGTTEQTSNSTAATFIRLVGANNIGNNTGESYNGTLYMAKPSGTLYTCVGFDGFMVEEGTNVQVTKGAGARVSGADVDAVRFYSPSGNMTSGTIKLYGIANS